MEKIERRSGKAGGERKFADIVTEGSHGDEGKVGHIVEKFASDSVPARPEEKVN